MTAMKILLVDDSNTMRRIEKNTLEKMGYTDIIEAQDGAEAVKHVSSGGFELVLMDWNMPNMTGIDALKAIKADPAHKSLPVIMVTSESEKTRIMEALQSGAASYVVKPFQAETLQDKINAVMLKRG
jgi:two-component system, chemotaxis family, chemotaxis protein CheY